MPFVHWERLENKSNTEKTDEYYQYNINSTYYRSISKIKKILTNAGFKVNFDTINPPLVKIIS